MKINGSEIKQLTFHESDDYEPIFSPDGKLLYLHQKEMEIKRFILLILNLKI